MWPVLFSIGPFTFKTLSLVVILAFLLAGFIFWRRAREEHYSEAEIFDGFLLSIVYGMVASRVVFIILQWPEFGFDVIKWVDIFAAPGASLFGFVVSAGLFLYQFAVKNKWDAFEVTDFWVVALSAALTFIWFGYFLAGMGFGTATELPWGMTYVGVFDKHHPVQLYLTGVYLLLWLYLGWVEYRYRTFSWYRSGKNTAQTGFLTSIFCLVSGGALLALQPIMLSVMSWRGVSLEAIVSGATFLFGLGLLLVRSGRIAWPFKRKRQWWTTA